MNFLSPYTILRYHWYVLKYFHQFLRSMIRHSHNWFTHHSHDTAVNPFTFIVTKVRCLYTRTHIYKYTYVPQCSTHSLHNYLHIYKSNNRVETSDVKSFQLTFTSNRICHSSNVQYNLAPFWLNKIKTMSLNPIIIICCSITYGIVLYSR